MRNSRKRSVALMPLAMLVAGAAGAQQGQPDLAGFGGGMHALAEACGGYTAAQLESSRQKQKAEAIARGSNAAQFDTAFDAGYAKSKAKLANATPAEREKACAQAEQMKQLGEQMNKGR